MADEPLNRALVPALLVLRVTLGVFLLQWGIEKFVVPDVNIFIWQHFYGLEMSHALGYAFGAAEVAIAACLFLGLFKTVTYGLAAVIHAVSMAVSWRQLIDPWGEPVNHLFIAGIPVLGAMVVLFLLRGYDRGVLDRVRQV